jgi:hypothetical protein
MILQEEDAMLIQEDSDGNIQDYIDEEDERPAMSNGRC